MELEFMAKPRQERSLKNTTGTLMANSIQQCCTRDVGMVFNICSRVRCTIHVCSRLNQNNCCRCESYAFWVKCTAVFYPNITNVHWDCGELGIPYIFSNIGNFVYILCCSKTTGFALATMSFPPNMLIKIHSIRFCFVSIQFSVCNDDIISRMS